MRVTWAACVIAAALVGCEPPALNRYWTSVDHGTPAAPVPTAFVGTQLPPLTTSIRECPLDVPVDGTSCTRDLVCEYGDNADSHCNAVAHCNPFNAWVVTPPYHACKADCPADDAGVATGSRCDKIGALCTYYEGTCGCSEGATDGGTWTCVQPAAGCPARRPPVGSPCVLPMTCDYGSCTFGQPLTFECAAGRWSAASDLDGGCLDRDR